ncbi:E3 ubiquitin-protein ligase RNF126-B-like isoform 2-T2 [Synchiropus picturatus]
MAETPNQRFFCHACLTEIYQTVPDLTCPFCQSGFVEELPEENRSTLETDSSSSYDEPQTFYEMEPQSIFSFQTPRGTYTLDFLQENLDFQSHHDNTQRDTGLLPGQRQIPWQPRSGQTLQGQDTEGGAMISEGIIQMLLSGILPPEVLQHTVSEPWALSQLNTMNFPMNSDGLDAVISELLNLFGNVGPPPADRDRINTIPTVTITEEHMGGLECPVCKEDYNIGENVRQLPCNHLFHNDCIVRWLEQHDSCPVCRESLSGQDTTTNLPASSVNFSPPSSSTSSTNSSSAQLTPSSASSSFSPFTSNSPSDETDDGTQSSSSSPSPHL